MAKFIDWLRDIDRRYIYGLVFLSLLLPLVRPFGLPVSVSKLTKAAYDEINRLNQGDIVLYAMDITAASVADDMPSNLAYMQHLMDKGVRVIIVTFRADGMKYTLDILAKWEALGKKYGQDLAHLGFVAGAESGIAAFFSDFRKTAPTDVRGKQTSELPIMKDVNSLKDVKILVASTAGYTPEYVRQGFTAYGKTLIVCASGNHFGTLPPYIQAGQIKGAIGGARGAAEYEVLLKKPGAGAKLMDSQAIGLMSLLLVMLLGNVVYLYDRRRSQGGN